MGLLENTDALSAYDPTLRDKLRWTLSGLFGGGHKSRNFADRFIGSPSRFGLADLTPGVGGILGVQEGSRKAKAGYQGGDKGLLAAGLLEAGLSVIPEGAAMAGLWSKPAVRASVRAAMRAFPGDESGALFRGYHGTPDADAVDVPRVDMDEPGAWFTSDYQYAGDYAKGPEGKIFEADLDISNPAVVNFDWEGNELVARLGDEVLEADNNIDLVRELKGRGYNGAHFPDGNFSEDSEAFVAFANNQISVIPDTPALNPAQQTAQDMLDLLKQGRGSEVTEQMAAAADPQYLAKHYDLPMDAASRMARAKEMGFDADTPLHHGSNMDINSFDRTTRGTWVSDNPDMADSYVARAGGTLYPVTVKGGSSFPRVDAGGANYNSIPASGLPDELQYINHDNAGRDLNTDYIASRSGEERLPGVRFDNIVDRGPNVKKYLGETTEDAMARAARSSAPSSNVNVNNPKDLRSKFARFDPRLKHLANLSAGVGGFGLLPYLLQEQGPQ
jgi:hypothetical protein